MTNDEQEMIRLLVDLHQDGERQGPGSDTCTLAALDSAGLDSNAALRVADIGCGTGASALLLASALPRATITAIDLSASFLDVLSKKAKAAGCADRIETREVSMDALPFSPNSLDLIWSEGAIYNIGFENGLANWSPFLRTGGTIAVSELVWLRPDPPAELRDFWLSQYAEIGTMDEKIAVLEQAGYEPIHSFTLPSNCWIDSYYAPTQRRANAFLSRHRGSDAAQEVIDMDQQEADLYERHQQWYGYGFFVARKR